MRLHHATWYLAALAAVGMPALAVGQGFSLSAAGSCATSRGYANTSAPCNDASMVFWNPAAITSTTGNSVLVGASAIAVSGSFTEDTTGIVSNTISPTAYPPHLFFTRHTAGSRLGFGFGLSVPYALNTRWASDFDGRFGIERATLRSIYAQPTLAWQVTEKWSVGGGPIIARSEIELNQSLDLSRQVAAINPGPPVDTMYFSRLGIPARTEFGRATLSGDAWGYGLTAAVRGQLSPAWEFGARYLSHVKFDYEGDAAFEQVQTGLLLPAAMGSFPAGTQIDLLVAPQFTSGRLQSQAVRTSITHPAQVQVGVSFTGYPNTIVSGEYAWMGWKSFRELQIDFAGADEATTAPDRVLIQDYGNSSVLRLGLEHRLVNPGFSQGWALRLGTSASASAAPPESVTPLAPEQDRYSFNAGAGIPIGSRYALDLAYVYVGTWGSRGRLGERLSRTQTAEQLNNGFFHLSANVLSLSLKATF